MGGFCTITVTWSVAVQPFAPVTPPSLSGPYGRQEFIVNRYPEAVRKFLNKDPQHKKWNTRVHHPEAMALIQAADVVQQLARVLADK